jgi:uncharacterized SAM-binding protein YcdF (DUF218 family)
MILLSKILPLLFLPLSLCLEFMVAALICLRLNRRKSAGVLLCFALATPLVFSNGCVRDLLITSLERRYLPVDERAVSGDVIVVLGGGAQPKVYPRRHVGFGTTGERVFEAVRLFKAGAAPWIVATGGSLDFIMKGEKEAVSMKELLYEFGISADRVLVEDKARNTRENALFVKKLLQERKLGLSIILVTSALHMPRAVAIFTHAGFKATPAPTGHLVGATQGSVWFHLLPNADALAGSTAAIREYMGIGAYRLLGWL